jgi:hypothetical protein
MLCIELLVSLSGKKENKNPYPNPCPTGSIFNMLPQAEPVPRASTKIPAGSQKASLLSESRAGFDG